MAYGEPIRVRDKVYALRSLVPTLEPLKVNYSENVLDVFFDVLQLGLLNSPTGCQKAAFPFAAMDLTISDLKQSIEAKCEDTIPFKILFAYEIEEADLPRTEVEASDMTYTSVDFYERQSDKLSLLSRFEPRSEIIRRARKGDYLCEVDYGSSYGAVVRKTAWDAFAIVAFMYRREFGPEDPGETYFPSRSNLHSSTGNRWNRWQSDSDRPRIGHSGSSLSQG